MKKLNKLFAVLLVFIMALTVTGCGKKDENYSLLYQLYQQIEDMKIWQQELAQQ